MQIISGPPDSSRLRTLFGKDWTYSAPYVSYRSACIRAISSMAYEDSGFRPYRSSR